MPRIQIHHLCAHQPPLTHRTSNRPPPAALSVISGTDNGCPDRKTLYTKVTQNESMNTYTISILSPQPSNIPNIEPSPLRTVFPMIVRYCYSTRIKLFRTRKLFGIDQIQRIPNPHLCRMSTTPPA